MVRSQRPIPDTKKGRTYRRVLWVVGIAAIVGIADQARALFWLVVAGVPEGSGPLDVTRVVIMLAGWSLLCWCAVLAIRKNAMPPTWALVMIPVMIWTVLLLPKLGTL